MNTQPVFFKGLEEPKNNGFRFSSHCPATLMATAYSVLGLEFIGKLEKWSGEKRASVGRFLLSGLSADGYFHDPLFREEDVLSDEHDLRYFKEETTSFCLQALDALGAKVPVLTVPEEWADPQKLVSYLSSLPWKNPWLDSNRVMFALGRLCYEVVTNGRSEFLSTVDKALDWLDTQQDQKTGLWCGRQNAEMSHAMAATVHFTFFYSYRRRKIHFTERIVDSCLSLQAPNGLFGGAVVGHTCFDYDAIQLLCTMKQSTSYRAKDVVRSMNRASSAIQTLRNPDGGFADAKVRVRQLIGMPLPMFLSKKISNSQYINCWKHLSCGASESNAYSTWLRLMTLELAETETMGKFRFRRLPFLGYRTS